MKLLVNAPGGLQELIEVGEGGGYFDAARVLWDERVDGQMPAITLGGMARIGNALVYDAVVMLAHNAAIFAPLKEVEAAHWMAEREKMVARMTSIESQLNAVGDPAGAASCRALRQSLLGLFTDPTVTAATTMPVLKAAFKARYKVATDLATTSAKLEFLKYET